MRTVNSLSGGKTSAYIAANYPADHNVFALVRTNDVNCKFPDDSLRKQVEDRIQQPFVGTLEEDDIIYTMFDLEQYLGQEIKWVTGIPFENVIENKGGYIPNKMVRYCTTELKVVPIFQWWWYQFGYADEAVDMRIGYRANETGRAEKMMSKLGDDGLEEIKMTVSHHKDGRNKWEYFKWRKPSFPLIVDGIYKDSIEKYWEDKPVRFANLNNCVGCYWRNEILLKKQSEDHPNKFEWFAKQERDRKGTWKTGITYDKIKRHKLQLELSLDDFNDCDSGYCGV